MAKPGPSMYIRVVEIGDTPASAAEALRQRLQIQVAVSLRFRIDRSWSYDLQSTFWRLYVVDKPGAWITHAARRIALLPDRIHLIPAWVRFQSKATKPMLQDYMHFYVTGLPPTLLRRFFNRPLLLPRDAALAGIGARWRAALASDTSFAISGWALSLAYAAIATASENLSVSEQQACADSWRGFTPIGPALQCIDRRLSNPPTNPELARLCSLSTDRFILRFHHIVGMTPAQYGLERRIARAAQWLTTTAMSIEQIAEGAGFTDRFHFSRVCKARLGLPPVAYRKLHRLATRSAQ